MTFAKRFGTVSVCLVAAMACGFAPKAARAEFKTPTAITNVTIVARPGSVIESGTIVMDEGRIIDVGVDVDIPAHADRLDGTGLIAYAGFIDAHSHLGIADESRTPEERKRAEDIHPDPRQGPLAATRFANRRGIRPQVRAIDLYIPKDKKLEARRAAGFTTVLIAPRDGILSGTSDLMGLSNMPVRRAVLASDVAIRSNLDRGTISLVRRSSVVRTPGRFFSLASPGSALIPRPGGLALPTLTAAALRARCHAIGSGRRRLNVTMARHTLWTGMANATVAPASAVCLKATTVRLTKTAWTLSTSSTRALSQHMSPRGKSYS